MSSLSARCTRSARSCARAVCLRGDVGREDLLRAARLVLRGVVEDRPGLRDDLSDRERAVVEHADRELPAGDIALDHHVGVVGRRELERRVEPLPVVHEREARRSSLARSASRSEGSRSAARRRRAAAAPSANRESARRPRGTAASRRPCPSRARCRAGRCRCKGSPRDRAAPARCRPRRGRRAARGTRGRPRRDREPRRRSAGPRPRSSRAAACRSCRRTSAARRRGRAGRGPSRMRSPRDRGCAMRRRPAPRLRSTRRAPCCRRRTKPRSSTKSPFSNAAHCKRFAAIRRASCVTPRPILFLRRGSADASRGAHNDAASAMDEPTTTRKP